MAWSAIDKSLNIFFVVCFRQRAGGTPGKLPARTSLLTSGSSGYGTSTAGMGSNGRIPSTGAVGRSFGGGGRGSGISGGGRGEEQATQPSPHKHAQQQEERWTVGAYVIMRGSVDLYVLER